MKLEQYAFYKEIKEAMEFSEDVTEEEKDFCEDVLEAFGFRCETKESWETLTAFLSMIFHYGKVQGVRMTAGMKGEI